MTEDIHWCTFHKAYHPNEAFYVEKGRLKSWCRRANAEHRRGRKVERDPNISPVLTRTTRRCRSCGQDRDSEAFTKYEWVKATPQCKSCASRRVSK